MRSRFFFFSKAKGGGGGPTKWGGAQPPTDPRALKKRKIGAAEHQPAKFRDFSTQNAPPAQARHNSPWGAPRDSRPLSTYSTCKPALRSRSLPPLFPRYHAQKALSISYSISLNIIYRERYTSAARMRTYAGQAAGDAGAARTLTYADVCGRVRPHTLGVE